METFDPSDVPKIQLVPVEVGNFRVFGPQRTSNFILTHSVKLLEAPQKAVTSSEG